MRSEATVQQQGPVESVALTRRFAVANLGVTAALVILITVGQASQITVWPAAIGGIAAVLASSLVYLHAASPFRAPVRRPTFLLVIALLIVGVVLDGAARGGTPTQGGWAIAVVPVTLFVMSHVRTQAEILLGGAAVSAALVITGLTTTTGSRPELAVALDAVITAVPATLALAALVRVTVRAMQRERREEGTSRDPGADEGRSRVERQLIALLQDVVETDRVTVATGARAQVLATGLRSRLSAEQDRDWIGDLGIRVSDDEGYADRMSLEQRTTLRGLVAALPVSGSRNPGWARLSGQDLDATLELDLPLARRPDSAYLGPAVLMRRTVFPGARFRVEDGRARVAADFSVA